ncbi:MAG: GFA family protein [Polyangiales bacterium]
MLQGSCLCGAVRVEVDGALEFPAEACHCRQCRKQTGHFFAGVPVRREALTVHGAEKVTWYRSSEKVRRGFCAVCGSTLFWDPLVGGDRHIGVLMGVFDTPTGTRIAKHTFVVDKGDYYDITDGAPQREGF